MRGDSDARTTLPHSDQPSRLDRSLSASHHESCDSGSVSAHSQVMNNASSDSSSAHSSASGHGVAPISPDLRRSSNSPSLAITYSDMATQEDQHLHNVGIAALAAVAQYPHAINHESRSFLVSEVVNAVTGGASPLPVSDLGTSGRNEHVLPPVHESFHSTRSEEDTLSIESENMSPVSRATENDVDMESIVQDLIERTATWQNVATIANGTDDDGLQKDMVVDYDSPLEEDHSSPSTNPDDDLEDLLRFYPDEDYFYHERLAAQYPESAKHDINLDEFYHPVAYDITVGSVAQAPQTPTNTAFAVDQQAEQAMEHPASIIHTTTYERNLTIDEFIQRWMVQSNIIPHGFHSENRIPPQLRPLSKIMGWTPPLDTYRPHEQQNGFYDLQQMPWTETLKVKRADARTLRDAWYTSYHNLDYSHNNRAENLPQVESYFRAKSMHTAHKASVEHFQLRNLMSVPAYNTVHFASRSKVYSWTPIFDDTRCLIDLSHPCPESGILGPVKISSMKSAHGLTIAGGFCGEYALCAAGGEGSGAKGLVTPDFNDGITNHVDIIPNRSGRSPICVFASNDRHLRILDCETNIFLSDQQLSRPINCTATSPDSRLRVVIGDSPDAWVIEADTGKPVHPLRGHRDFGFACAWSPDMCHIATSNQDKTVIIWDTRTWRPLETIDSDVAGYRSLRYSPVGGGPRTLLCCEPADRISIIDAQLYQTRQVHDFFGEIGGADYSPDGNVIWVANTDPHFGGFMQYERQQWGHAYGLTDLPNEWLREAELESDPRCVLSSKERQLRFLRNLSDDDHDSFIL